MDAGSSEPKQNGGPQRSVVLQLRDPEEGAVVPVVMNSIASQFQDICLSSELPAHQSADSEATPSNISSDSEDAMYSVGSTPAGTPVRVAKHPEVLSMQEQDVRVEMESLNELLHKLEAVEQRYELRDREFEAEKTTLQSRIQKLEQQLTASQEEMDQTVSEVKKNLNQRLDQVTKQLNSARKELESMVMKYAMSEKQILDARKGKEMAEKHLKDVVKDKDSLSARVKALTSDKCSLTSALDKKITELAAHQKENDRLVSETKDKDLKLKQSQQRLQATIDAYDEAKEQLVNLNNVLEVLKRELELSKHNELQTTAQSDSSPPKIVISDSDVEHKVDLTLVNDTLRSEIVSLKENKLRMEQQVDQLQRLMDQMKDQMEEHNQTRDELEKASANLLSLKQENQSLFLKLNELSSFNRELQQEVELHRQKEAEMLDLSERLREKVENCQLQRDELEKECQAWRKRVQCLDERLQESQESHKELIQKHDMQVTHLQNHVKKLEEELNQSQSLAEQLKVKMDEIENDKRILSKRQTNVVKELNKEVIQLRKKLQVFENQSAPGSGSSLLSVTPAAGDGLSATSRTSSSSSIDLVGQSASRDTPQTREPVSSDSQSKSDENADGSPSDSNHVDAIASLPELDKAKLVDRILKLQKTLAKRSEKMDFLEDHNHQLVEELKKKTRLIQYYLLREESGALTTAEMDRNKRELLRKGATTMSSLYKNTCESEMTLDLSLEINRKLQAVLEDTILKNITLKDSLSTLGDEIARLNGKQVPSCRR